MNRIPDQKGFVAYRYPDKSNPKVINYLQLDPDTRWPLGGRIFAEKEADLTDWIRKYVNPSVKVQGKTVQIHALWKDPDSDHPVDDPTPYSAARS